MNKDRTRTIYLDVLPDGYNFVLWRDPRTCWKKISGTESSTKAESQFGQVVQFNPFLRVYAVDADGQRIPYRLLAKFMDDYYGARPGWGDSDVPYCESPWNREDPVMVL